MTRPKRAMAVELQCAECDAAAGWALPEGALPRTLDELRPHLEEGSIAGFRADHVGHRVSVTLYEVLVCTTCGHPACPRCRDWCDRLVPVPCDACKGQEGAEHVCDEIEPCCGMECTYSESLADDVVLTAVV